MPRAPMVGHDAITSRIKWLLAALACAWALGLGFGAPEQAWPIEQEQQAMVIESHACTLGSMAADLQESAHECDAHLPVAQALPMQPCLGQPCALNSASRAVNPPPPLPPPRLRA